MKRTGITGKHLLTVFAAVFLLAACGSLDSLKEAFDDGVKKPMEGERISVLQLQKGLAPNPALRAASFPLPDAWTNQFWPQAGGYPSHTMGHLSLSGDLKRAWSSSIGTGGDRTPLTAAPIVADDMVFTLDAEGMVTAFSLSKGDKKWRQSVVPDGEDDTGVTGGGMAYSSGKIFATSGYKQIVCLNAASGHLLWKAAIAAPVRAAPTVMDDKIFLITMDNQLMVYDTADGSPLWNYTGVSETTNLLGSASVAADSSVVVLPLSSGELIGLRPENGAVVWEDNLSAVQRTGALSSITDIRGLPVMDQGVVYAISYSGRMVAIDQVTGNRLWQREVGSAETPWAAGDSIFIITSDQQLVALARQTGDIRWVVSLPKNDNDEPSVWTGPVLAGGRLITAGSGGELLEISPDDGKILKTSDLPGDVTIAPVVADNTLLLTRNGELVAYR